MFSRIAQLEESWRSLFEWCHTSFPNKEDAAHLSLTSYQTSASFSEALPSLTQRLKDILQNAIVAPAAVQQKVCEIFILIHTVFLKQ